MRTIKHLKERLAAKRSDKFGFHKENIQEIQREIELIENFNCKTPKENKKTQKSQDELISIIEKKEVPAESGKQEVTES